MGAYRGAMGAYREAMGAYRGAMGAYRGAMFAYRGAMGGYRGAMGARQQIYIVLTTVLVPIGKESFCGIARPSSCLPLVLKRERQGLIWAYELKNVDFKHFLAIAMYC